MADSKDKASTNYYFASVFSSEDGLMQTLDKNSFSDISPLLILIRVLTTLTT